MFEGRRNTKATFSIVLTGTILPINLLSFTGKNVNGTTNNLFIKVAEAVNVKSVIVERSADGMNFKSIGQITKIGNSFNGLHNFTDANALKGINYYRLKTNDVDGNFEYSNIVTLKTADQIDISLQPNPFNSFINIKAPQTGGQLTAVISDAVSKKIAQKTFSGNTQMATSSLAKGVYLISIYV